MSPKFLTPLSVLTLAVLAAQPGCSVLTVDVDVYKGPLANHSDIQAQQTMSLAAAAKPILGKLRYLLEARERYERLGPKEGQTDDLVEQLRDIDDYVVLSTDRIAFPSSGGLRQPDEFRDFKSSEAAYVNRILANYSRDGRKEFDAFLRTMRANDKDGRPAKLRPFSDGMPSDMVPSDIWPKTRALDPYIESQEEKTERAQSRLRVGVREIGLEGMILIYGWARERYENELLAEPSGIEAARAFNSYESELRAKLLGFSQQILFVANNNALVAQLDKQPGLGGRTLDALAPVTSGRVLHENQDYTRVLQAVGNSILVQLDELQKQRENRERLKTLARSEAELYVESVSIRSSEVFTRIRQRLENQGNVFGGTLSSLQGKPPKEVLRDETTTLAQSKQWLSDLKAEAEQLPKYLDRASATLGELAKFTDGQSFINADPEVIKILGSNEQHTPQEFATSLKQRINAMAIQQFEKPSEMLKLAEIAKTLGSEDLHKAMVNSKQGAAQNLQSLKDAVAAHGRALVGFSRLESRQRAIPDEIAQASEQAQQRETLLNSRTRQIAYLDAVLELQAIQTEVQNDERAERASFDALATIVRIRQAVEARRVALASVLTDQIKVIDALAEAVDSVAVTVGDRDLSRVGTPQDILDKLAASLRHQLIQEIQNNGDDSPRAKNLRQALNELYRQRGGFSYIRPASAYLRTSFAATSLQRDARLGWNNMLFDQALRGVPLVNGLVANPNKNDLPTLLELDKQFWQNVNTIRVAGGGNTNYAVVKDDVGNWYVKNYSADPEPIIKGAKALVQYGASAQAAQDTLAKAIEQRAVGKVKSGKVDSTSAIQEEVDTLNNAKNSADGAATPAATPTRAYAAESALLQRQATEAKTAYTAATKAALANALAKAKAVDASVETAWKESIKDPMVRDAYEKATAAPAAALAEAIKTLETPPAPLPAEAPAPASSTASSAAVGPPAAATLDDIEQLRRTLSAVQVYHNTVRDLIAKEPDQVKKSAIEKLVATTQIPAADAIDAAIVKAEAMDASVHKAWEETVKDPAIRSKYVAFTSTPAATLTAEVAKVKASTAEAAARRTELNAAIKKYLDAVTASLTASPDFANKAARESLTSIAKAAATPPITDQRAAMSRYTTALDVLHQSVQPPK